MTMERFKLYSVEVLGTTTSGVGVITSFQTQFDYWLRQLGVFAAILAAGLTTLVILRNEFPEYLPRFLRKKPPQ